MADSEHFDILKQGVEQWNAWRAQNVDVEPDLREGKFRDSNFKGADLHNADLRRATFRGATLKEADLAEANCLNAILFEANLAGANLRKASLDGANLRRATLHGANLEMASLSQAALNEAKLQGSNLQKANLTFANLEKADLRNTNLGIVDMESAVLTGANLAGALFGHTNFADTNLINVQGLQQCRHFGPSTVDHRTLEYNPLLPAEFLRGCGFSELEILSARLLYADLSHREITDIGYRIIERRSEPAIKYHSCFISYSSKDADFARRLYSDLQASGVGCWYAPEDLKIGDRFPDVIEDAVRLHDKLLLILSKASVKSDWVQDEVEAALEKERKRKEKVLFPIQIDNAIQRTRQAWALKLRRQRHIGDFRAWDDPTGYDEALQRLLRDLQAGP